MKKLIYSILAVVLALVIVNAQTDWFANLGDYAPELEEKYPEFVASVEEASDYVSDFTDMLPTPSEIIAMIKNEELPLDPSDVAVNAYI